MNYAFRRNGHTLPQAVPSFIEDRAIYMRERMNGAITVWPYVISQTLVSLPFMFLIAFVFTSIMYPMCNFHHGADKFFMFTTFLWLALMVAEAMTVAVSAIIPHFIAGVYGGPNSSTWLRLYSSWCILS